MKQCSNETIFFRKNLHISKTFITFAGCKNYAMKIAFYTLGCKLNFAESSSLSQALLARGHEKVRAGEAADVCVVNTCSVTDQADHKDKQLIRRIRRQHPKAKIIVTGCLAQLKPQEVAAMPEVDYVLGMDEKFSLESKVQSLESEVVADKISISKIREVERFCGAVSKDDRTRCFLKVQDGCNYFCTYCTIPFARGKSRNGSIASLVEQAREAIASGAKEIVLTGVNIGDFGRSTGEKFIDLLKALDSLESEVLSLKSKVVTEREFRYRISSCEPNLLTDEIIEFVAQSKHFAPHFHIPLQSGSDSVLRLMKRHYDTTLFRERIEHIKSVMPDAFIGVDVMTGVRGETEELFEETVRFLESLDVSQLHVFTYSERANTKMLDIEPVVPAKERKRRSEILHALSEKKTAAFYASQKGKKGTVLWESRVRSQESRVVADNIESEVVSLKSKVVADNVESKVGNQESINLMGGWTENYVRVLKPYDKEKINTFEEVEI